MAARVERPPYVERLPYSIGRFGAGWFLLIAVLLVIFAGGVAAYSQQYIQGLVVTGMRDIGTAGGAAWGLYITFDVYFVGVSFAGITVAALIRLLNLKTMKPVARMAELLTVVALILAAFTVLPDLGQPLRAIVNLFRYARPQSPFFGTFSLVISGYLFASLVYLYLDARRDAALCALVPSRLQWFYRLWAAGYRDTPAERQRHERASFFLALAILPLLVTAHSTLGFVFGLQIGRPGWFSALQAPGFVVMAGISGVGLLILIAAILRGALGERERLSPEVFRWLGNMLMALTLVYLYFMLVDWLTTMYQGAHSEQRVTQAILVGEFAWLYWLSVATLVIPAGLLLRQFLLHRYSLGLIVLSGLLVNVAAVGKRYLLVVPSQVQGTLLPYGPGSYSPSQVEYSVIVGLVALGTLLYVAFMKVFPIMEVEESHVRVAAAARDLAGAATAPRPAARPSWRRAYTTAVLVIAGFGIQAASYLFLAAPWGFPPSGPEFSNPRGIMTPTVVAVGDYRVDWLADLLGAPPAPLLFVAGIMLVFLAAVFYELLPERQAAREGRQTPRTPAS